MNLDTHELSNAWKSVSETLEEMSVENSIYAKLAKVVREFSNTEFA